MVSKSMQMLIHTWPFVLINSAHARKHCHKLNGYKPQALLSRHCCGSESGHKSWAPHVGVSQGCLQGLSWGSSLIQGYTGKGSTAERTRWWATLRALLAAARGHRLLLVTGGLPNTAPCFSRASQAVLSKKPMLSSPGTHACPHNHVQPIAFAQECV